MKIRADVAMCLNDECPSKDKCLRYMAEPNERQVYADFKHEGDDCEEFKPIPFKAGE